MTPLGHITPVAWDDRRLSFGSAATDYDAWRPTYPDAALRWLLGDAPRRVLDLGAGTGRLAVAASALGHDAVAVEPDPGMRAVVERALPGRAHAGTAEQIPLGAASVDAVVVGQAWHWFDHDRAVREIARVLRPDGVLGLLWNLRDESTPWMRALGDLVGGEDRVAGVEQVVGSETVFGPPFGEQEWKVFGHARPMRVADLSKLADTWSFVRLNEHRAEILAAVDALGTTHPAFAGRDEVPVSYACTAIRASIGAR